MHETRVWIVWLRIARLPGCRALPDDFDPRLECALQARSEDEVRAKLDAALARDRWTVEHVEDCRPWRAEEWDAQRDPQGRIRDAANRACITDEVVWASFARAPLADDAPVASGRG